VVGRERVWPTPAEAAQPSEPRWTPENRPVVDGSKPASGAGAPSGESVLPHRRVTPQVGGREWWARGLHPGIDALEKPEFRGYPDMG